jgi:hypothetical protein
MDTISSPLPLSEAALCRWLGEALPGDMLAYHRGHLTRDVAATGAKARSRAELQRVARRALWASESELVHLVQRRNGPDDYTYLAVARPRPKATSGSTLAHILRQAERAKA